MKLRKILVANRGEIAIRVMRTCRDLGIDTVAIYAPDDRLGMHVRYAPQAYALHSRAGGHAYLDIEQIVDIAKKAGADAVHPGYGFLSENPQFADALKQAGIGFIGPDSGVMRAMSSKTKARQAMQQAGVPVVPGLQQAASSEQEAFACAQQMGFPVMLKAAMGGGGKGMRKVDTADAFSSAWQAARSEAKASFGDDAVYVEKFLDQPRHIEVQVFGDEHGCVRAFTERECSVQRRHQKIIEESPSPFVDAALRERMTQVACKAAASVGYVGAGTIEFLVDARRNFYFMEMNTRLQVEHPITEMVSGLDLVKLQIDVAQGQRLDKQLPQHFLQPRGWSMEARVCAEDPDSGFLPSPGVIREFRQPGGPFVRTDTAAYAGSEITTAYDPLIAKVIGWGNHRQAALTCLDRALAEFIVKGCKTNTMFVRQMLRFAPFYEGVYDTSVVQQLQQQQRQQQQPDWFTLQHHEMGLIGAALLNFERERRLQGRVSPLVSAQQQDSRSWKSWQVGCVSSNNMVK
ncbi:MAG: biotin carboxylase N-terminal domain-containing protein [Myxococcota bacterium]